MASRALELVGTPFRLHGRNADIGLDCIGVLLDCLDYAGAKTGAPAVYGLRNANALDRLAKATPDCIITLAADAPILRGDIIFVRPGPAQLHCLIATSPDFFVHAHAGLRKTVAMPAPLPWPVLQHLRLSEKD